MVDASSNTDFCDWCEDLCFGCDLCIGLEKTDGDCALCWAENDGDARMRGYACMYEDGSGA